MALPAVHNQRGGIAAAAADLDLVAEPYARWSARRPSAAEKALAARRRPLQELRGAVHRFPLLVAGDEEREAAAEFPPAAGDEAERGRDHGGKPALHVDRAAAVEHAVDDLRGKRRMPPARLRARRHDIDMAGERQVPLALADRGEEVFDRRAAGRLEDRPLDWQIPRAPRWRCKHIERRAGGRRDARRAHQFGQKIRLRSAIGRIMRAAGHLHRRKRSGPPVPGSDADPDREGEVHERAGDDKRKKPAIAHVMQPLHRHGEVGIERRQHDERRRRLRERARSLRRGRR